MHIIDWNDKNTSWNGYKCTNINAQIKSAFYSKKCMKMVTLSFTMYNVSWRNVICNVCVLMAEIYTTDGGQKDDLLRGANV